MKGRQTYRLSLVTPARKFERQIAEQDKTNQRLRAIAERLKPLENRKAGLADAHSNPNPNRSE